MRRPVSQPLAGRQCSEYEGLTFAIEAGSMTDANEVAELIREARRLEKQAQAIREKSDRLQARAEELAKQIAKLQESKASSK